MLAKLYLTTLAIVDPVPVLSDDEIAIVLEKFKSYGLRVEPYFIRGCFYHTLVISLKQTPIYRTYHPA